MILSDKSSSASSSSTAIVWVSSAATVTAAAAYGAWVYWLRPTLEGSKPFDDLPMPPTSHWFYGHLLSFRGDLVPAMRRMGHDFVDAQGRMGVWMGPGSKAIVLTRGDDVRAVLLGEHYRRTFKLFRKHASMLFGNYNVSYLTGRLWKYERAAILRSFSHSFLPSVVPAMQQVTQRIVQSIQERIRQAEASTDADSPERSVVMEMESICKMITMDVFGLTAFSHDFRSCETLTVSPEARAFEHLSSEMMRRINNPFSLVNWFYSIPTQRNKEYLEQRRILRSFIERVIGERRAEMEKVLGSQASKQNDTALANGHSGSNGSTTPSIMDYFSQLKKKDLVARLLEAHAGAQERADGILADVCTDDVLVDVMLSLLFAGHDTSSITLAYALYIFATNEEIRRNCWEEIDRLDAAATATGVSDSSSGNGDAKTTPLSPNHDTDRMVYCRAFLTEVLRLYPPGYLISRKLQKDMTLPDGYVVPGGTLVYFPIWSIHRTDLNFERPEEFHVERWVMRDPQRPHEWLERSAKNGAKEGTTTSPSSIAAANKDNWFAFSAGARTCPGQGFAWQETLLVFTGLVRELNFEVLPDFELIPERHGIVQRPRGGISFRVSQRAK